MLILLALLVGFVAVLFGAACIVKLFVHGFMAANENRLDVATKFFYAGGSITVAWVLVLVWMYRRHDLPIYPPDIPEYLVFIILCRYLAIVLPKRWEEI